VVDKVRKPALHCPVEVVDRFKGEYLYVNAALYGPAKVVFALLACLHFKVGVRRGFFGFERSQILTLEVEGLHHVAFF